MIDQNNSNQKPVNEPIAPSQPHDSPSKDRPGRGVRSILSTLLAALLGIQSEKNRREDFEKGRASDYIIFGIIAVFIILVVMITFVNSVISTAGQ